MLGWGSPSLAPPEGPVRYMLARLNIPEGAPNNVFVGFGGLVCRNALGTLRILIYNPPVYIHRPCATPGQCSTHLRTGTCRFSAGGFER